MIQFRFNRFWKVLSWLISVNRIQLLGIFAGCAAAMFMIEMVMIQWGGFHDSWPFIVRVVDIIIPFVFLLLGIFLSLSFSSFTSLGKKTQRSTFLMLPASNLEKFLALVLYVTFICTLCAYSGMIIGDTLRMVVMWFFGDHNMAAFDVPGYDVCYWWSSVLPRLLHELTPNIINNPDFYQCSTLYVMMQIVVFVVFWVWAHSLFLLGGTLMRKYSFVVSAIVFVACIALFVYTIHTFHLDMLLMEYNGSCYICKNIGTVPYVLAVVLPLFSVFNYWASFHIFKGFQLITNKWTNYDFQ